MCVCVHCGSFTFGALFSVKAVEGDLGVVAEKIEFS